MTIIKLTTGEYDNELYINVDNMTMMERFNDSDVTQLYFVGDSDVVRVKETPKQIIAKIRRAVGRLAPVDAEDASEH